VPLLPDELADELAAATGLEVRHGRHRHVRPPGAVCLQRLALEPRDGRIVLATWAAELGSQARSFYGCGGRVEGLLDLVAGKDWAAEPNGHLGYWLAPFEKRWYFAGGALGLEGYLTGWQEDLERVHSYPRDSVEAELWPWLAFRGYAGGAADRRRMAEFLHQAKAAVHLRPSVRITRRWTPAEIGDLHARDELRAAVRRAVDEVLDALDEPALGP
jgi:hypothetical protein